MSKRVIHKHTFRWGWYTKLCDDTLFTQMIFTKKWEEVTCKKCLKLKDKRAK